MAVLSTPIKKASLTFILRHFTAAARRCKHEGPASFYNELVRTMIMAVNHMPFNVPYRLTAEIVQDERIVSIPTQDIASLKIELEGTVIARLHFNRKLIDKTPTYSANPKLQIL